jgi:hypothetical protein
MDIETEYILHNGKKPTLFLMKGNRNGTVCLRQIAIYIHDLWAYRILEKIVIYNLLRCLMADKID